MATLDEQTNQAFKFNDGPATPPAPTGPNNTYEPTQQDRSIWQTLRKETQDFLRSKHPYLAPLGAMAEMFGPTGAAADVRDYAQLTESAARNAVKGRIGDAAVDAGYGAAALGAAFIPGLGGIGEMRRAVNDTSLFRQNPDRGVSEVKGEEFTNPAYQELAGDIDGRELRLFDIATNVGLEHSYVDNLIDDFKQRLEAIVLEQNPQRAVQLRQDYAKNLTDVFNDIERKVGTDAADDVTFQLQLFSGAYRDFIEFPQDLRSIRPHQSNLQSFYNPIESAIENLPYNKNGTIRGDKARQYMQDKGFVSGSTFQFTFPDYSGFDPKREYTQAELQDLYKARSFDVIGYTERPSYESYQRQSSGSWGEIQDYQELLIDVVPSQTSTRGKISSASHFTDQNLAHARVSIRTADGVGVQQLFHPEERYVLVEEIQSDFVQNPQRHGRSFDSPFLPEKTENAPLFEQPGASPVKGIGDTTRLSLLQTIMYAKENGVNFVVVPSPEDIAYAGRVVEGEEIPKGFYNTYRDAVKKALNRIQQETKGQVTFETETYTPQEEFITGEGFLEDVPLSDAPNEPRTVTIIDISQLEIDPERTELRFNKGGLVPSMEDQTMAAFGQPSEVDPVSGNPVPPGGTPEGVRDDIDAKLSEGEFVIPAHVVRFVGVTQLMQLIQAAEAGIQQMEQQGMTGQPVNPNQTQGDLPFDPATLETEDDDQSMEGASGPVGFNTGGLVQDNRLGKAATTPAASQLPSVALYRDRTGFIRAVPVVNGKPVGVVPPGAELISGAPNTAAPSSQQQTNSQPTTGNNERWNELGYQEEMKTYDTRNLTGAEARQMLGGQRQISDVTNSTAGRVARSIAGMVPGLGQVMSLAAGMQQPITSALANRVLEEEYGMKPASALDNFRGRTSAQGARTLGRPETLLDQLDRGRESGGVNIGVAEHTRTPGVGGAPDTITVPSLDKFNEGWGFVTSNQESENRDGGGYSQSDLSSADFGGISEQRDRDLGW